MRDSVRLLVDSEPEAAEVAARARGFVVVEAKDLGYGLTEVTARGSYDAAVRWFFDPVGALVRHELLHHGQPVLHFSVCGG